MKTLQKINWVVDPVSDATTPAEPGTIFCVVYICKIKCIGYIGPGTAQPAQPINDPILV